MDILNKVGVNFIIRIIITPFIFLHTSKSIINFIKWPYIQINFTTLKSPFFIKQIHTNASNSKFFTRFLKHQDNIYTQSGLHRKHTIPQLSKILPFIYADIVAKIYLLNNTGLDQFFTSVV